MSLSWENLTLDERRRRVEIADEKYRLLMRGVPHSELERWLVYEQAEDTKHMLKTNDVLALLDTQNTKRLAAYRKAGMPAVMIKGVWHYDMELVLDWATKNGAPINRRVLRAYSDA